VFDGDYGVDSKLAKAPASPFYGTKILLKSVFPHKPSLASFGINQVQQADLKCKKQILHTYLVKKRRVTMHYSMAG